LAHAPASPASVLPLLEPAPLEPDPPPESEPPLEPELLLESDPLLESAPLLDPDEDDPESLGPAPPS
jgi:hypothetical protein